MRRAIVGLIGVLAMSSVPLPMSGAEADPTRAQDTLWLPWIGCWEGAAEVGGDEADSFVVCFQTLTDGAGVEIRTYAEGELVATEEMLADETARPLEEGGCVGERTASWSLDRARVFLVSELDCGEGVTRSTRGVLSILPGGDGWVEIQSVLAGTESPLIGIRTFLPVGGSLLESDGITDPAAGRELAVRTARSQASRALTPATLVETVERAGPSVASALLVERGEQFGLDAETLRALSVRGVPGEVIDVMVALSYPERFEISGSGPDLEPGIRSSSASRVASSRSWPPSYRYFGGYSPWGFGYDRYLDPFWSGAFGYGYGGFSYNSFGYSPYGFGSFGSSIYRSPRLIFIQPPSVQTRGATLSRNHGVVTRGGSDARPSGSTQRASPAPSSRSSGASRAAPSRSSSGGGSRAAPSRSTSGSSSGGARRARPRNGGSND